MNIRDKLRRRASKVVRDKARRGFYRQERRDWESESEGQLSLRENAPADRERLRAEAGKEEIPGLPATVAEREYFVDEYMERRT